MLLYFFYCSNLSEEHLVFRKILHPSIIRLGPTNRYDQSQGFKHTHCRVKFKLMNMSVSYFEWTAHNVVYVYLCSL